MSLFLNTSNLNSLLLDCSNLNISDTIERDCLSVLHKLHDQVNGLQLVQVVVQPLARLFNPASLAALAAANVSQSQSPANSSNKITSTPVQNVSGSHSNASTPSQFPPTLRDHSNDLEGHTHSRSQSFASSFSTGQTNNNNSLLSTTSTYMMSPDTAQALIARLDTDRDVNWLMEIIGYGLSMPFSITGEQDSVKDCCTIYCEWLASALLPYNEDNEDSKYQQLSKLVPVPIRKEPNRYARKMLSHLYNVFLPRQPMSSPSMSGSNHKEQSDAILTAVSRQAVLCHRVLRTIENIAQNQTNLMDNETWHHLLALLLTVNDKLLSAPTEPDDIGTQLQDRISGVLFELMLLACSRSIPDTSLWKTFHEMCLNWRHRPALVDHWRRITLLLTKRIVQLPSVLIKCNEQRTDNEYIIRNIDPSLNTPPNNLSASELAVATMSYENLSQTWYRFLNLIGNPVELADPSIISRTDEFYHAACVANNVLDPRQHPCLNVLPQIFMNSMLGLKDFIESFICYQQQTTSIMSRRTSQTEQSQQQVSKFRLNPDRPRCNAILQIFGDWLFSAALIGSDLNQETNSPATADAGNISGSTLSVASSSTTEVGPPSNYSPAFSRRQSHQSTTSSHTSTSTNKRRQSKQDNLSGFTSEKIIFDPPLSSDSFESGQAEAMAILCRIFSSKSSSEDICPAYLARFYLCLQHCLAYGSGQDPKNPNQFGPIKRQLLASVLINSTTLLQKDLDGINLLIPSFIKAIEFVFECSEKEVPIQPPPRQNSRSGSIRYGSNSINFLTSVTNYDLRRACILTLVNLLAYPFHFQDLVIRNCLDGTSPTTTFGALRPRLLKLLFVALQTETDGTNMQILFGGLSLAIHDLASNENKISGYRRDEDASRGRRKQDSTATSRAESTHSSLETNSGRQDDTISQSSLVFNSNYGFLIKSLHVTCHLLINIWKHDNLVSLAALEVLTTIARVSVLTNNSDSNLKINNNNNYIEMKSEYMQTTKWICDYICNQCSRPPPAHSRDMHSTIVAAYQCLSVWFYNHSYLLNDNNCVNTLMEVIELGVSGQKSKSTSINPAIGVATQTTISKGEKHMKPSSMRVREAAESLLNICMVRTGHSGMRNIALCDTVLDESYIAESFGGTQYKSNTRQIQDNELRQLEAYKLFKYFSDEDSIVFGFFEGLNHDQTTKDSVICLMRTPFGKHCWKMKFNYYSERSREKIIANKTLGLIKRPFQQCTTPVSENRIFSFSKGHNKSLYFNNTAKFFPETIENLSPNSLDNLVTSLDEYVNGQGYVKDIRLKRDLDKINKIFSHQVLAEQKVIRECSMRIKRVECEEPLQMTDLETARIIVTHLGLKTALCSLSGGDKVSQSFVNNLRALDSQSVRTCDSVNIFYVRKNRTTPIEILESVRERHNVSLEFFEWLLELGQPAVVKNHNRWTGKVYSCWNSQRPTQFGSAARNSSECHTALTRNQMLMSDHGGAIFDGDRMTLYWSDMCQELAFLVPHRLEKVGSNIMICWLECPDDMANVPCDTLLSISETGGLSEDGTALSGSGGGDALGTMTNRLGKTKEFAKYFISPMKNGLFRVNLMTSFGRQWLALPLVDGMTVSKGMLSSLVRESVLNLCRRRRLDTDSYQPPHVKRRLKIQDICNNFKISSRYESSEFYYNLFRSNKAAA